MEESFGINFAGGVVDVGVVVVVGVGVVPMEAEKRRLIILKGNEPSQTEARRRSLVAEVVSYSVGKRDGSSSCSSSSNELEIVPTGASPATCLPNKFVWFEVHFEGNLVVFHLGKAPVF